MNGKGALHSLIRKVRVLWIFVFLITVSCISVHTASFFRAVWPTPRVSNTFLIYKDTEDVQPERFAQVKHSFGYKLAEKLVLSDGIKRRWNYSAQKLSAWVLKTDQSKAAVPPSVYYREFAIEKITVQENPCFFLSSLNTSNNDKVIMYLHGGGFVLEMHPMHWDFAAQLIRKKAFPVCIPMYPIYPIIDTEISVRYIIECYRELLRRYPESEIIMLGDSSGANLVLSICHFLSQHQEEFDALPFPDKLILISPTMAADKDDELLPEMERIAFNDVMLSMNLLETMPEIFQSPNREFSNETESYWYTAPFFGDFSLFPPIYVFSGTYDIFYPQIKPFVERVRSQGKYIEFYTGYKMMHDWVMLPAIQEGIFGLAALLEVIENEQ